MVPSPNPIPNPAIKFTKLFINNEWVNSVSGKKFPTINPATEKVIVEVAEGDKADIDKAVAAARKAFSRGSEWRKLDAAARGYLMFKLADLMEENINELASLESLDNGKRFSDSYEQVLQSTGFLRYLAGAADKIQGSTVPGMGNTMCIVRKEPVGVVGAIVPWNYPVVLITFKLGHALAAGCTIVLKPAEQTPLTALYLANLCKEAGFPAGVINVVPGYGPTAGAAISEHHDVNKVTFTGSTEVGKYIMKASGDSNLKRVSLELGGKSPLVVFNDADLDLAAMIAHQALFTNAGQTCIAPTRVFVQSKVHDEFVKKFVELAKKVKVGSAFEKDVLQGPQIDTEIFDRVMSLIEAGKKQGAKCEIGGKRYGKVGYFVEPTVFTNVTDDMRIAKEEIFGPVQSILKFETLEEVIRRANDTTYGLAAGVFTKSLDNALEFSKGVESGTVCVNTWGAIFPATPFGGYKMSGIGREMGKEGIETYLETKSIVINLPTNH